MRELSFRKRLGFTLPVSWYGVKQIPRRLKSAGDDKKIGAAGGPEGPLRHSRSLLVVVVAMELALLLTGCAVGPNYTRPKVVAPPSYKETPASQDGPPADAKLAANWWEMFNDPQLNALEAQVDGADQTLKQSEANFLQARAMIRFYRSNYYPTVGTAPSYSRNKVSSNRPTLATLQGQTYTDIILPLDVSYEPDIWGQVRRSVEANRSTAQSSFANMQWVRLTLHAGLALDYMEARSFDAEEELLQSTVAAYTEALKLTENRFHGGVASEVDVEQARTMLETTRAQAIDIESERVTFENAIATLIGKPAPSFTLPPNPLHMEPPSVPVGLPSQILERRPDIAAAERSIQEANANIGVAKAAYYPQLSLTGSTGFESSSITSLLTGPSAFWTLAGAAVETIFDGGRRRSVSEQAHAAYDQTEANYQQTVLTAFQEVEDNLAALRILADESNTEAVAVAAAQRSLQLSINRYTGGVTTYLEVTTAQAAALTDERTQVEILGRRMTDTVLLIKALGGGWDDSQLPDLHQIDRATVSQALAPQTTDHSRSDGAGR
jgi:NodT family efflux transporter outer membrane factor (OMF) lipoprotein